MDHPERRLIEAMADIALAAGPAIMKHFCACQPTIKSDGSPVTMADSEAEALILPALEKLLPGIPIIAEEAASLGNIPEAGRYFLLVDPLDGTKEFISGSNEFTVNIGLVRDGVPIAGVIHAPAINKLWFGGQSAEACDAAPGSRLAGAANRRAIHVRKPPLAGLSAVASKLHSTPESEAYLARLPVIERRSAGSSLKFCLIAEGLADVYPRFSPTMEWDTAAGHAILLAAGGDVRMDTGEAFVYGKRERDYRNSNFIAASSFETLAQLIGPTSTPR